MESGLTSIETSPPPAPPRPGLGERTHQWLRDHSSARGAAVVVASLAVVALIGWLGLNRTTDLGDPPRDLAFAETSDEPPGLALLEATASDNLFGWQSCSSFGGDLWTWNSGVAHRDQELGAVVSSHAAASEYVTVTITSGSETVTGNGYLRGRSLDGLEDSWYETPAISLDWPTWTVDEVLELSNAVDVRTSHYVDRYGDTFTRFESMPAPGTPDAAAVPFAMAQNFHNLIWVLDVWEDGGVVRRIRIVTDGPAQQWKEWRRLDSLDSPAPEVPDCEPEAPFANHDWIGLEGFSSSRTVPAQIDFDDDGNPFDTWTWDGAGEVDSNVVGEIAGPITTLGIGDLESVTSTEWSPTAEAQQQLALDWPAGATIELIDIDGLPVLSLLTSSAHDRVTSWDDPQELAIYGSFVTLTTGKFAVIDEATLDTFLEPFWEGTEFRRGSFDGVAGDEITMLTQSSATAAVAGRDADGAIVALALWDEEYRWRELAIHPEAPPSVLQREQELRACLEGTRTIETDGRCTWSS